MNSWLIVILLTIMLIICMGMLLIFHWEIKKMTKQLDDIIENFGTNELIRTSSQSKTLKHFITKINRLIQLFKQDQQHKDRREKELKQEITNISHDLRTPLTSIKGFSELLTDPALSEEEKQESLSIIQKKIDSLTMMIDLFYELSQINSSDNPLMMEQLSLDQAIVEAVLIFHNDFEQKALNLHVEESQMPFVFADEKATNRIIANLLQNALYYAKSNVHLQLIEQADYITLRIINDIDGLDQSELQRIFDRSYRADTSRSSGQLGLGLHIVQKLIYQQGGKIDAAVNDHEFRMDVWFRKWDQDWIGNVYDENRSL